MSVSEFKKLSVGDIKKLKSAEVTADGQHLFTAIIPHGDMCAYDYTKTQAEYLGMRGNVSGGVDPEEINAVPV
jgi:hypothetical protein